MAFVTRHDRSGIPAEAGAGWTAAGFWGLETTKGSPRVGYQAGVEPSEITHPRNKYCTADETNL